MRAWTPGLLFVAACGVGEIVTSAGATQPDASLGALDAPLGALDAPLGVVDAPLGVLDAPLPIDPDAGAGPLLGQFQITYYYVTAEADYTGVDDTTLYQPSCEPLSVVPKAFAQSAVLEGTGELTDGRVINYTGACDCPFSPCFRFVDAAHPWGTGAGGRALVPFRSVAVDRRVLTIGHHYFVKELAGLQMPGEPPTGGFIHDGCISADDTGGAINDQQIDFFAALKVYYRALDRDLGLTHITLYDGGDRCP